MVYTTRLSFFRSDLRKHELTHSEERPFACAQCSYRTSIRTSLLKHERTHGIITANFVCLTCERYYLSEFAFKNHLQKESHSGKRVNELSEEELKSLAETQQQQDSAAAEVDQTQTSCSSNTHLQHMDAFQSDFNCSGLSIDAPVLVKLPEAGDALVQVSMPGLQRLQSYADDQMDTAETVSLIDPSTLFVTSGETAVHKQNPRSILKMEPIKNSFTTIDDVSQQPIQSEAFIVNSFDLSSNENAETKLPIENLDSIGGPIQIFQLSTPDTDSEQCIVENGCFVVCSNPS